MTDDPDEPLELPITHELDLHTFSPRDATAVVEAWLEECVARGFDEVRVVHGKGTGALRERVHRLLEKHPDVESFRLAGEGRGSWGATIVRLRTRRG